MSGGDRKTGPVRVVQEGEQVDAWAGAPPWAHEIRAWQQTHGAEDKAQFQILGNIVRGATTAQSKLLSALITLATGILAAIHSCHG